ncbi:hypothetical protein ACSBR2_012232 [Camellia fascicularis]
MSWLIWLHQLILVSLLFSQVVTCSSSWSSSTSAHHMCLEDQKFSLLQFKKTFTITSGLTFPECESYSHPKMVFWNESIDCCSWDGVTCDWLNGHVIGLDLSCSELQGTIQGNSSLFHLRQLQRLNLAFNDFSFSKILSRFGSFTKKLPWLALQYIDLHDNLLHGPLPVPPITTTVFLISSNKFTGEIPPLIYGLGLLKVLDLSNNSLSGMIPQCLENLSNSLSVLNLRMNSFHGAFTAIFTKGSTLRNLNLNDNQIEGQVPQSLLNCGRLEVLDLGRNKINDTFPYWLETLPELQVLVLKFNRFHGHINTFKTKSKLHFPKLRIIDISYNEFTGLLPTNYISRFEAMMNGTIHANNTHFHLRHLQSLNLAFNYFYLSRISSKFGSFASLIHLNLSFYDFEGQIPSKIFYRSKSISLDLSNLNDYVSSSVRLEQHTFNMLLRNLTQLRELHLDLLNISSPLPHAILNLSSLTSLSLELKLERNSELTGKLPYFNVTSSLQFLDLSCTSFSSQFPESISNLKALNILSLFECDFSGSIPASCGNLTRITKLWFNNFSSQIPSSISNLAKLTHLDLSENNLYGQIPDSLGNMSQLTNLDLFENNLNGQIPDSLGNMSQLT